MKDYLKSKITSFIAKDKLEIARSILALLLSLLLTVTAICFIYSCVSIYKSDADTPFSREIVAEHLEKVAPISFITIGAAIAAGVVSLFANEPKSKSIPIKKKTLLSIIEKKLSPASGSEEYLSVKEKEKKKRRIIIASAAALSSVFAIVAMIFVLDPSRYTLDDVNLCVAYSAVIGAIAALLAFSACFTASILLSASYGTQLDAAREELKRCKAASAKPITEQSELSLQSGHTVSLIRIVILAVSVTFIIIGVFNGGMADVLGKAVRICTECIGLG